MKTGKSKLYKAQLHNPVQKIDAVEKDLTARQVFYSNDHLFLCGFGTDISFVKLKHYSLKTFSSKKTLNQYANFIGVSLPQTLTYKEMIERITVLHLEEKNTKNIKKKVFEKFKINIADQGNTKFEIIYFIDKNLTFASDCANKHIATLTIKDDGYGFFCFITVGNSIPTKHRKSKMHMCIEL